MTIIASNWGTDLRLEWFDPFWCWHFEGNGLLLLLSLTDLCSESPDDLGIVFNLLQGLLQLLKKTRALLLVRNGIFLQSSHLAMNRQQFVLEQRSLVSSSVSTNLDPFGLFFGNPVLRLSDCQRNNLVYRKLLFKLRLSLLDEALVESELFSGQLAFAVTALHLHGSTSKLEVAFKFFCGVEDLVAVLADSVSGAVFKVFMELENVHSLVLEDLGFGIFQSLRLARFEVSGLALLVIDQGRLWLVILCFCDALRVVTGTVSVRILVRFLRGFDVWLGFSWASVSLLHLLQ